MEDFLHIDGSFYEDAPCFHGQFLEQTLSFNDRTCAEFPEQFQTLVVSREGKYSTSSSSQEPNTQHLQFPACSYDSLSAEAGLTSTFSLQSGNPGITREDTDISWAEDERGDNNTTTSSRGQPLKKIRRLRANDRERRRMRSLNRALDSLKKCLPVPQSKRRVTKLEILRIACSYIRSLSDTLSEDCRRSNEVTSQGRKSRTRGIVGDPVVNGFSVAQRLEILSGKNAHRL